MPECSSHKFRHKCRLLHQRCWILALSESKADSFLILILNWKSYFLNHQLASHPGLLHIMLVCQQLAFSHTTVSKSFNISTLQTAPNYISWYGAPFPLIQSDGALSSASVLDSFQKDVCCLRVCVAMAL